MFARLARRAGRRPLRAAIPRAAFSQTGRMEISSGFRMRPAGKHRASETRVALSVAPNSAEARKENKQGAPELRPDFRPYLRPRRAATARARFPSRSALQQLPAGAARQKCAQATRA